jgi:hypothetical protein
MNKGLYFVCTLLVCAICDNDAAVLFSEDFTQGLSKKWEPVKFEGRTDYTAPADDRDKSNKVLQARAASSASGLGTKINIPLKPNTTLSWRWKIDKTPKGGSDDEKKTFDHTARLFVAFKTSIGPPRTINYVWANKTAVGKTFHHPSSGRARFIVLQNADAKANQWITEKRDVYADWKQLFGHDDPPNIVSIGLMTDSDGTGTTVNGWYDDIQISAQ